MCQTTAFSRGRGQTEEVGGVIFGTASLLLGLTAAAENHSGHEFCFTTPASRMLFIIIFYITRTEVAHA